MNLDDQLLDAFARNASITYMRPQPYRCNLILESVSDAQGDEQADMTIVRLFTLVAQGSDDKHVATAARAYVSAVQRSQGRALKTAAECRDRQLEFEIET